MAEYERSQVIAAAPEAVFGYVSAVENLPRYLATTRVAEPAGPNRVRVAGSVQGRDYDTEGLLRASPDQRRLEWGSEGDGRYAGWLQVYDYGDGQAELNVHLSFFDEAAGEVGPDEVEQGLATALQRVKDAVESAPAG